jgi:predicted dithiol-disulfide oxidoreductase (DUF899 family)
MGLPDIVSCEDWLEGRRGLLALEKEAIGIRDALNADRRRLPLVKIHEEYVFPLRAWTDYQINIA